MQFSGRFHDMKQITLEKKAERKLTESPLVFITPEGRASETALLFLDLDSGGSRGGIVIGACGVHIKVMMVEYVEPLGSELDVPPIIENLEMFQERDIEIRAFGIVH